MNARSDSTSDSKRDETQEAEREGASAEAEESGASDAGAVASEVESDADTVSSEIMQELKELQDLQDRHLRLAAEFENYRKRTRRELLETRERAHAELAAHLLDVLDDLGRVATIPTDATTVEALHQGVELVERKFLKALADAGMQVIEAEGVRFDPNLHEALATLPTDDPDEDEIVAQVLVPGYRLGDRLLRPARVQVKQYVAPEDAAADE